MKKDGACSWEMTIDAKTVPWGASRHGYHFAHIFHQVRHPLKVISSLYYTESLESFDFIRQHIPEITPADSHLTQCAKYWYYWNLKAEAQAEWTYRIEEIDHLWDEFALRLNKKINTNLLTIVPKTVNSRGATPPMTWEQIQQELEPDLYQKIRALAENYGYIIHDPMN